MSEIKRLVISIVKFLVQQLDDGNLTPDAKESVEVAVQCLETAYGVDRHDPTNVSMCSLLSVFSDGTSKTDVPDESSTKVSEENKAEAENLKNEGNNLIKAERYQEAINAYTRAIELDRNNAVYFCNRAAAYNKLGDFNAAVEDCKKAISIDPHYSKAYGRMGFAYASLNKHEEAIHCYRKAADIEPDNESYRNNLKMAEEKVQQRYPHTDENSSHQGPGISNSVDIGNLLRNPTLVNMATQLMQDPYMQNLMSGFMSSSVTQTPQAQNTGLEALLQAGQQLASHMQQSNPQLVASLRQQLSSQENAKKDERKDQQTQ